MLIAVLCANAQDTNIISGAVRDAFLKTPLPDVKLTLMTEDSTFIKDVECAPEGRGRDLRQRAQGGRTHFTIVFRYTVPAISQSLSGWHFFYGLSTTAPSPAYILYATVLQKYVLGEDNSRVVVVTAGMRQAQKMLSRTLLLRCSGVDIYNSFTRSMRCSSSGCGTLRDFTDIGISDLPKGPFISRLSYNA